ncbi:MAG: hypothetical protein KGI70_03180 [Patescibacteria group bacterium]|nr:hypothetical protein [Patescibacteria group bacterium]
MRTIVGVLRGGEGGDYDLSLKTGASVLEHLDKETYDARDIFISKEGEWHSRGVPMAPEKALMSVDVAFNALHGEPSRSGSVQRLLERLQVPYTHTGPSGSSRALNKVATREVVHKLGIKVPHGIVVSAGDPSRQGRAEADPGAAALKLFRSMPLPLIVKPSGHAKAVAADSYQSLESALEQSFAGAPEALVEEYIPGKLATVHMLEDFRGEPYYAMLPIETSGGRVISPGTFSREEKGALTDAARSVHKALEFMHLSAADFLVNRRGIYFVGANTHPILFAGSLVHHGLSAIGAKLGDLYGHLVQLARAPKPKVTRAY